MRSCLADFNVQSGAEAERKRELDSLHDARAGVSNGRNSHHLVALGSDLIPANRRGKGSGSDDVVDIVLVQQAYEAFISDTLHTVRGAEDAVERVLDVVAARLSAAEERLDALVDAAAVLPDGTRIARSEKDGQIYTLDGLPIDPYRAEEIVWAGKEPSFEEIDAARDQISDLQDIADRANDDMHRLGEIREELDDQPPEDRVRTLSDEAGDIMERNAEALNVLENSNSSAPSAQSDFKLGDLSVPSL